MNLSQSQAASAVTQLGNHSKLRGRHPAKAMGTACSPDGGTVACIPIAQQEQPPRSVLNLLTLRDVSRSFWSGH